jgi:hypothetical protein
VKVLLHILSVPALLLWSACSEQPDNPNQVNPADPQVGQVPREPLDLQESPSRMVEGTLTRVDPNAMSITIRTTDGSERMFTYSDQTLVSGADGSVAGLATRSGARVRVWYATEGGPAEEIEIVAGDSGQREPGQRQPSPGQAQPGQRQPPGQGAP